MSHSDQSLRAMCYRDKVKEAIRAKVDSEKSKEIRDEPSGSFEDWWYEFETLRFSCDDDTQMEEDICKEAWNAAIASCLPSLVRMK